MRRGGLIQRRTRLRRGTPIRRVALRPSERELKGLMRKYLMLRDGGVCVRCGGTKVLQGAHVYPQGKYRAMRYACDNLMLMCYRCHRYWWHANPIEATLWFWQKYTGRANKLSAMAQFVKPGPLDLALERLYLESMVRSLGGTP